MPKTARQLEKIKAERKDQIVLAGLKVFCEKGYDGAKVDDIVKKAGCSHGLFYHYFRNKQEIFDEIMKNANNDTYEVVEKYISSGTGAYREKLRFLGNLSPYRPAAVHADRFGQSHSVFQRGVGGLFHADADFTET